MSWALRARLFEAWWRWERPPRVLLRAPPFPELDPSGTDAFSVGVIAGVRIL